MMRFASSSVLLPFVGGHGEMTNPPTRILSTLDRAGSCRGVGAKDDTTVADGICRWFNQGCQPGCSECTDFGPACKTPMKPTILNKSLMTWNRGNLPFFIPGTVTDLTRHMPWRSPGFAPVFSPCGIAGGGTTRFPANGALAPATLKEGFDGRDMPPLKDVETIWPAGSVQEVAWAMAANHGGGYAYRLCPKSSKLTEECFQSGHLRFASDQSWIQYGSDKSNRTAIPAHRVSVGTNPKGSQWTKHPVPACGDTSGGVGLGGHCKEPPMFEPPLPGLFGYGSAMCALLSPQGGRTCSKEREQSIRDKFRFNIIDTVEVPANLPIGDYMVSFRWDCEQTPQVWAQCADITVTAPQTPELV